MACNENIIKNMANEVTRICHGKNVFVETEFVAYMIDLLLYNPKYGKLFKKTLNRNCLAYFVNECVAMIMRGGTPLNTLKMQYIMLTNYDALDKLIEKHQCTVEKCLSPLHNEILDEELNEEDVDKMKKMYRKISIYTLLASGLGNPGIIHNLKESMAALESVFKIEELPAFLNLTRTPRKAKVDELTQLVAGVRLFNRDCKQGGDSIPNLPFDLVDAANASLSALSNALIAAMQRVNTLTTAIDDCIGYNDETKSVVIHVKHNHEFNEETYKQVMDLLILNRQYEMYVRRMLNDVEFMLRVSEGLVDKYKLVLLELHAAVKYKTAVPCDTVFPMFKRLWEIWKNMQNAMFVVSTINKLMSILNSIQEANKIPHPIIDKMLQGRAVVSDEDRMSTDLDEVDLVSRTMLRSITSLCHQDAPLTEDMKISSTALVERHISFLGFCAMALNVGALLPSNTRVGVIKYRRGRYGFCSVKMAARFSKDPERHVKEVLNFARNNPHVINLLGIAQEVRDVRDIDELVTKITPKTKTHTQHVQTLLHPVESHLEHNYTWDLWEWKRRACQWATIVNCKTHATQTVNSHMRSEIHSQTYPPKDKSEQTMKTVGVGTNDCKYFIWGLRGQIGDGQRAMDFNMPHDPEKVADKQQDWCDCSEKTDSIMGEVDSETKTLCSEITGAKEITDWIYKLREKLE